MADTNKPGNRDVSGRFTVGNDGGPGRRKFSEVARSMMEAAEVPAIKVYIDGLMACDSDGNPDLPERRACADALLNRLHGKPAQAFTGEDGRGIMASVILLPAVEE